MSRAYETSLANRIVRLDRLIAESEALRAHFTDEETLSAVKADLARWRESRDEYESILRRTTLFNSFTVWTVAVFWSSFALLWVIVLLGLDGTPFLLLVAIDVVLLIGSGMAYVGAIVVRDAVALGRQPWRYSLRSLLITTTVIAVLLALLTFVMQN